MTGNNAKRCLLRKTALPIVVSGFISVVVLLSHPGSQSRAASNYLHTSGGRIIDASGNLVGLSGVNWFGLETANYAPHGLWTRNWQDMLGQVKDLGYNVIRLPFSNAMLKPGVIPSGIDYNLNPDLANLSALEVMDKIVAGADERGILIILDNHRSTPGGGPESNGLWYTSDYPESQWIEDWKMLAGRYMGNDAVIGFDLRNEPFGGCWGCGDPLIDWRLAAERAGNAVHSVNPGLLIIVEGTAVHEGQSTWWGGNLLGAKEFPVRLNVPNQLVYSPHEYPESIYPQTWFSDPTYPNNLPAVWDKYWGHLGKDTPILIGEFGSRLETVKDQQWFNAFQSYIKENGLNWTFWSLNPNSGDTGGLLLDDWISVNQQKQEVLENIQYPFLQSPRPTSPSPSISPSPSATERPAETSQTGAFPQDWSAYQGISISVHGSMSGNLIRLELADNRLSGSTGDTAERFEYKFTDNFTGWKKFDLDWAAFTRRSDWQPAGAPNDGLNLTAVRGINIAPVHGNGSLLIDRIKLLRASN